MALNNFHTLLRELDNIPLHPINLTNTVKTYKEKISQLPKNIAPYLKRYGAAVPFAAGVALYVGGMAHMTLYYPEDRMGFWYMLAGTLMMAGTTFATILYEKVKKNE